MIEPSAGIPAHIALLLNEKINFENPTAARKHVKGMASELRAQAEVTDPVFPSQIESAPNQFRVALGGGLDLFAGEGACQELVCRIGYAVQVARSITLMADQVVLHDYIGEKIRQLPRRPTNAEIDWLLPDLMVLQVLSPLIDAGLLQFVSTYVPACQGCISEFERQSNVVADEVLKQFSNEFSVERKDAYTAIDTGPLFDPHLTIRAKNEWAADKDDQALIRYFAKEAVRSALWTARDAAVIGGSMFSNSGVGLYALLAKEGRRMNPAEFRIFAGQRAAQLPWVNGLNVRQTLELREEASNALPALREFLARKLSAHNNGAHFDDRQDYVDELREQAATVRAELEVATSKSPSLRRNATGVLGLGVSALSLATGAPAEALASLLGTLGLIHQVPANNGVHERVLKAKPGYVLIAAQDILAHARS